MSYKTVDPSDIPEVAAYVEAEEMMRAFVEGHPEFAKTVRGLLHDLDQKRQAAEKVVKARGIVCGPWKVHSVRTSYDAGLLCSLLGEKQFLEIGGAVEQITQRKVDKKKLEMAIAKGEVPADTVKEVKKDSLAYKGPKGFDW